MGCGIRQIRVPPPPPGDCLTWQVTEFSETQSAPLENGMIPAQHGCSEGHRRYQALLTAQWPALCWVSGGQDLHAHGGERAPHPPEAASLHSQTSLVLPGPSLTLPQILLSQALVEDTEDSPSGNSTVY